MFHALCASHQRDLNKQKKTRKAMNKALKHFSDEEIVTSWKVIFVCLNKIVKIKCINLYELNKLLLSLLVVATGMGGVVA